MAKWQVFGPATLALLLTGILGPEPSQAGPVSYNLSVNTSSLSGQTGNLDFQFNPGGSGAQAATATVTNFQTVGGIPVPSAILTGNASGLLPGTLTLVNATAFNDVFQGFAYGSSFSFNLTLSGPALNSPGGTFGSSFALSLYDAAGVIPLLTTDTNGSVLTVNLTPNGSTSAVSFPQSPTDNTPAAVATLVSTVPEPSTILLLASALPGVWFAKRRMRCYRPGRSSTAVMSQGRTHFDGSISRPINRMLPDRLSRIRNMKG